MGLGGQHHAPAALPPVKTRYPSYRRLGRPQNRSGRVRKISPPPGFNPRTVHSVASRYTDWAIPAPNLLPKTTPNYAQTLLDRQFSIPNWRNSFILKSSVQIMKISRWSVKRQLQTSWDCTLLTAITVPITMPDITLVDSTNKEAAFIDIAIPLTHNLQATVTEKTTQI